MSPPTPRSPPHSTPAGHGWPTRPDRRPPDVDNLWLWYDDAAKDRRALLDALSEVEAVYQAEVARLRKQIEDEPPEDSEGWPDGMCPNCVTPWKCNGPHIVKAD